VSLWLRGGAKPCWFFILSCGLLGVIKNLVKEVMWHGGCFLRFALGFQLASKCSFFLNVKNCTFHIFVSLYIFLW
jgi:hypothetical protein